MPNAQDICLEIRLFGPMEAKIQGEPLPPLRSRKGLYALALLALRHDRDVPRSYLAALLWPDSPEEQSLGSLRRTLTDLRQAFGEFADCLLSPTSRTLRLDFARVSADVVAFDRDVQSSQTEILERAVALYRGPLMEGCLEEWALQEREEREEAYLTALEKLAALYRERGELAAAENRLARAVRVRPWRETAQRDRMEILASLGDYAAVTLAYRELREQLRDALNADPDAQTTALYQRLRADARRRAANGLPWGTPLPGSAEDSAPDPEPETPPALHNLRIPLTPLIGRNAEKQEIGRGLQAGRLVCLTGMGGVGKTRLATDFAWDATENYPGGVWFVDLSLLTEAAMVSQTVAAVFGVREQVGQTLLDALRERLGNRRILLFIDNCEHLLDTSAELIGYLLSLCPNLHVLATSRQGLGLSGEKLVPLAPFPLPNAFPGVALPVALLRKYDALRLFTERASTVGAFELNAENAADILQICQALDGIPLALELAAAQTKTLHVAEIARRLREGFHFLTGKTRDLQPRQRTLQSLLDWSYDLLTPTEQTLFRRMTIFVGGATMEAAESICCVGDDLAIAHTDILPLLSSLLDKSLVAVEDTNRERRYRMLETVRQYGRARLEDAGETEEIAERHREWFLQFAQAARPHLEEADSAMWDARLEAERENLRAALKWSVEREARLRLAVALTPFWLQRGNLSEGRAWLEGSLTRNRSASDTPLQAMGLHSAGIFAWMQGDFDAAQKYMENALEIFEGFSMDGTSATARVASLQNGLGILALERGGCETALDYFRQSHDFFAATGDAKGLLSVYINQGVTLCALGRYSEAKDLHRKALNTAEAAGNVRGVITSLGNLAEVAYAEGDDATAGELWTQCLRRDRELNYPWGIAASLANLGDVARRLGNRRGALSLYQDSLRIARPLGEKRLMVHALEGLAMTNAAERENQDARRNAVHFLSVAVRLREGMQMPLPAPYRDEVRQTVAELRQAFGEAVFSALWQERSPHDLDAVIEAALVPD